MTLKTQPKYIPEFEFVLFELTAENPLGKRTFDILVNSFDVGEFTERFPGQVIFD